MKMFYYPVFLIFMFINIINSYTIIIDFSSNINYTGFNCGDIKVPCTSFYDAGKKSFDLNIENEKILNIFILNKNNQDWILTKGSSITFGEINSHFTNITFQIVDEKLNYNNKSTLVVDGYDTLGSFLTHNRNDFNPDFGKYIIINNFKFINWYYENGIISNIYNISSNKFSNRSFIFNKYITQYKGSIIQMKGDSFLSMKSCVLHDNYFRNSFIEFYGVSVNIEILNTTLYSNFNFNIFISIKRSEKDLTMNIDSFETEKVFFLEFFSSDQKNNTLQISDCYLNNNFYGDKQGFLLTDTTNSVVLKNVYLGKDFSTGIEALNPKEIILENCNIQSNISIESKNTKLTLIGSNLFSNIPKLINSSEVVKEGDNDRNIKIQKEKNNIKKKNLNIILISCLLPIGVILLAISIILKLKLHISKVNSSIEGNRDEKAQPENEGKELENFNYYNNN
ncbi:hypothetical protein DICPUDRAFT_76641 [Dictyostelium purpureum]|uniref:Uncharacterized protein n=1 Tax=Dictyostelium purpureum TaxID=5786 RepID=F0ZE45_DICPU|nr:uncharacterized protein DICPUDRAFT_76641 [Dictyostelium purpureum]EGC37783.1 hypothetical protein DICPUDRAFT_76641 [Dictyostelium purpureum]|eukprot:XP_003285722.1 hypothetical protein DICPUDRAFT_76641 [Dictyostelium purpureum]